MTLKSYERSVSRFWAKADKTDLNGCWPWLGATRNYKYGGYIRELYQSNQ